MTDTAKAILWSKFIALREKEEKFQINNLNIYLKNLETKQQTNPKGNRRGIVERRAKINNTTI